MRVPPPSLPVPLAARLALGLALIGSLAVFAVSLPMTVFFFPPGDSDPPITGIQALLQGWLGPLAGAFEWYANPAYLAALILSGLSLTGRRRYTAALWACVAALALGAPSVFVHMWYFNEGSGTAIGGMGPAFRVWMASFAVLLLGLGTARRLDRPPPGPGV